MKKVKVLKELRTRCSGHRSWRWQRDMRSWGFAMASFRLSRRGKGNEGHVWLGWSKRNLITLLELIFSPSTHMSPWPRLTLGRTLSGLCRRLPCVQSVNRPRSTRAQAALHTRPLPWQWQAQRLLSALFFSTCCQYFLKPEYLHWIEMFLI